jgi:hypothetical protein
MFIAALTVQMCPSLDEWIKNMVHVHNEILLVIISKESGHIYMSRMGGHYIK